MATQARGATEDDLRATPRDGRRYELVDGAIVVSPAGVKHGEVSMRLGSRLLAFVEKHDRGHEDRPRALLDKVGEYLQAGVRLVWVVDPRKGEAAIYRSLTDIRKLQSTDSLDGEEVLPGFRCNLAEILK